MKNKKNFWTKTFIVISVGLSLFESSLYGNTISDPVGFIRIVIPTNSETLVSAPFDLIPSSDINVALCDQLTGATNQNASDVIRIWDPVSLKYISAYKFEDNSSSNSSSWLSDFSSFSTSSLALHPGRGFFIANQQAEPQAVFLCGNVVLDDNFSMPVYPGLNLLGYPYSSSISVNDSSLCKIGEYLYENNLVTNKEYIVSILENDTLWLENNIYSDNYLEWIDSLSDPSSMKFNIGTGFWYMQNWTNATYWTEVIPYDNYFPANTNPPVVVEISPIENNSKVKLAIRSTGDYGELLEIYYKDLNATETFDSLDWNIGLTNMPTSGSNIVYWVDAGSENRSPVNMIFSRYYIVGRGDIDNDYDNLPDAREVFVYNTGAYDADSDNDGLDDGEEVYTYNSNPTEKDSDDDGINDGQEVLYSNDPVVSNHYATLPFLENFETNTVTVGMVDGQNSWRATLVESANVQTGVVYEGTQSLGILNLQTNVAVRHLFASSESSKVWIDMMIQVTPVEIRADDTRECAAAFAFGTNGCICVYDGSLTAANKWLELTNHTVLEDDTWVRITTMCDYDSHKWLICLNGTRIAENLGFASEIESFSSLKISANKSYSDNISISDCVPAGIDSDNDGLEDVWELQCFGSLDYNSDTDSDGDGLSNIEEYNYGTDPLLADSDGDGISDEREIFNGRNPLSSDTYLPLPFSEIFEVDTVVAGELDGQNLWSASPTNKVLVQTNIVYEGQQTLEVSCIRDEIAVVEHIFASPEYLSVWLDFMLEARKSDVPENIPQTAALFGFNDEGYVWLYDGTSGNTQVITNSAPFNTGEKVRFSINLDYISQEWLICINNIIYCENIGFASYTPAFSSMKISGGHFCFDGLNISDIVPSGLSLDYDNMPDYWEEQYFGSLDCDDTGDYDGDGLPNLWEYENNFNPTNAADGAADGDGDGLTNAEEYAAGTSYTCYDTDQDGLPDGWEVNNGINPLQANADEDPDEDGLTNAEEYQYGFDPLDGIADNDMDGLTDIDEITLFGTSPFGIDTDSDGTNDAYNVLVIDGTNTTYRNGTWTNNASTLIALDNHYMRAEYTISISQAGMCLFGLSSTNCYTQDVSNVTFQLQVIIDDIPVGWIETTPTFDTPYVTTPWLTAGEHSFRIAWLDDYADGKLLGIENVILKYVDGADLDFSGVSDWEESRLEQDCDSDADGLSDLTEITSGLEPLAFDTDGDTLGDGEELNTFGTNPLTVDSDTNSIPDAVLLATLKGVETSYRQVSHITTVWQEDGDTLYEDQSGMMISYDFTVTNSSMYKVAFDIRNYNADAPDDYRFEVQLYVNGFSNSTQYVFADLDEKGTGTAYIITPWLTPGTHSINLKWLNNNDSRGRYANIAVDEVRLYGFDSPDVDGDGVQDWQAEALQNADDTDGDGISDYDEITIYGTSPVLKDTDGDGIDDDVEISLGLDSTSVDSDSDGVTDWQEINETMTDPLVAEFDGTVTVSDQVNGADRTAEAGSWQTDGTTVVAEYRRGQVEYQMTCPATDIYRLQIEATHQWRQSSCSSVPPIDYSDMLIYIDGVYIGKCEFIAPEGIYNTTRIFTPSLDAGTHTIRICWENTNRRLSLQIKELQLQQLGGVDLNSNGIRDWIEAYLANMTGITSVDAISLVSPVCLEGQARYVPLTSISASSLTNTIAVEPSITGEWYSDVSLSPTGSTQVAVSFQSGAITHTTNITWATINLLDANSAQIIRKGDSLKFTAQPAGATNGTVTIGVGNTTNTTDIINPVVVEFSEAGTYTVTGSFAPDADSGSMLVTVVEAAFPANSPACMIGKTRTWQTPDIPVEAVLESDSTVSLGGTLTEPTIYMSKINRDHHIIARLGENGPILAKQKLNGFWVQAAVDGYVQVIERYEDSQVWEQNMVTKLLPDNVDIEISIFIGGVTFADDLAITRWITSADLNEIGEYSFQLIHPNSVSCSTCHRIKVYENETYLGEAYYSGILVPDE